MTDQISVKKIILLTSAIFLVAFLFYGFLYLRYSNDYFKIDHNILLNFMLINGINTVVFSTSILFYKKYLNPVSLFCLFVFYYAFSLLPLSPNFSEYSKSSNTVIIVTIISFISGSIFAFYNKESLYNFLLFNNFIKKIKKIKSQINSRLILYVLFYSSIIVFFIEIYLIGYIPVFKMFSKFVYEDANDHMINFLHYFVVLSSVLPAFSYILYKNNVISKREYFLIHAISFFINFNFFSRQFLLLYMISLYFAYLFHNKSSFKFGITVISLMIMMFLTVGFLRFMQDNTYKTENQDKKQIEYLNNISNSKYKLSVLENYLTIYSSNRFYELNKMINEKDSTNYYGYGMYTFKPIVSVLFLNRLNLVDYDSKFNIPNAVPTFVVDAYLDFGITGSILINFIYGFISTIFFYSFWKKKKSGIINFSIIVFCIAMMTFMNYFNTFFVWFVLIINNLLIKDE